MDLSFLMVFLKKYLFDPVKRQNFRDASGQIFCLVLRPCRTYSVWANSEWWLYDQITPVNEKHRFQPRVKYVVSVCVCICVCVCVCQSNCIYGFAGCLQIPPSCHFLSKCNKGSVKGEHTLGTPGKKSLKLVNHEMALSNLFVRVCLQHSWIGVISD